VLLDHRGIYSCVCNCVLTSVVLDVQLWQAPFNITFRGLAILINTYVQTPIFLKIYTVLSRVKQFSCSLFSDL
jgi:type III secretory pathway component EscR